ncbi:MAG: DUF2029 domain-containing protein [Alphaproteobacteria bacterium]|nr:DUF2029 domain-containing protein [Alphaproteobacteria bacterium]
MRQAAPVLAVAILAGLYAWAMLMATLMGHDGAIGLGFNAMGADWVIWEGAARAVLAHQGTHIYDQAWITAMVNHDYAGWLSQRLPYPVFPYPPVMLLLVTPFALLPMPLSMLAFESLAFAALAWVLGKLAHDRAGRLFFVMGILFSPAAALNMAAGQNGFLTAALLAGGFVLLESAPVTAGIFLGLLILKPQFMPLAIVALIAMKSWRPLAAMVATVIFLILLSLALFGPELWLTWADTFLHPQQGTGINGNSWGHMWDSTVSTCLSLVGAPDWAATAGLGIAALIALALVWRVFRQKQSLAVRLGVLLCATLLASPHLSSYDMVALALAALIAVTQVPRDATLADYMVPLAAYAIPIYCPPRHNPIGLLTPLLLLALMGWFLKRGASHEPAAPAYVPA